MGSSERKQMTFLYDPQPDVLFSLSFPTIPFCVDSEIRRLVMPVSNSELVNELIFRLNAEYATLDFTVNSSDLVPATLGSMDPHTLLALDSLDIDMCMFEHSNRLSFTKKLGSDGSSIFAEDVPIIYPFRFNRPTAFDFNVGEHFLEIWYIGTKPLRIYLYNNLPNLKATTSVWKDAKGLLSPIYISENIASSTISMMVRCKSIWSIPFLLGEMDPYTLGELDQTLIAYVDNNVASVLRIGANVAEIAPLIEGVANKALLKIGSGPAAAGVKILPGAGKDYLGLSCSGIYRASTLGELDEYELIAIDPRSLNFRVHGAAVLTVNTD